VNTEALVQPELLGASNSEQRQKPLVALDAANAYGGTPTPTAIEVAHYAIEQMEFAKHPSVVLITDGVPTYGAGCVGDGTTLPANDTAENRL
jgi:Mg-chelatase subunit ChlD